MMSTGISVLHPHWTATNLLNCTMDAPASVFCFLQEVLSSNIAHMGHIPINKTELVQGSHRLWLAICWLYQSRLQVSINMPTYTRRTLTLPSCLPVFLASMACPPFHSGCATLSFPTRIPRCFVIVCNGNHVSRAAASAASYRAQEHHRTLPALPLLTLPSIYFHHIPILLRFYQLIIDFFSISFAYFKMNAGFHTIFFSGASWHHSTLFMCTVVLKL
jgi:hypothetical protein